MSVSVSPNTVNAGRRQLPRTPTLAETGRRRAEEYLNQVGCSYGGAEKNYSTQTVYEKKPSDITRNLNRFNAPTVARYD